MQSLVKLHNKLPVLTSMPSELFLEAIQIENKANTGV